MYYIVKEDMHLTLQGASTSIQVFSNERVKRCDAEQNLGMESDVSVKL